MDKNERKILKSEINDRQILNIEEISLMFKYFLQCFLKNLAVNNYNKINAGEAITTWNEFKKIIKEEKNFYKFMLKYQKEIDFNSAYHFIDMLDYINEKTVRYFIEIFDCIEDASERNTNFKRKYYKRNFDTLIQTNTYKIYATGLLLKLDDIKQFFNFPPSFWQYIDDKIIFIDSEKEQDNSIYGVLMKFDDNSLLKDIKIIVPYIIDLDTALINVHEIKHAYDLYQLLGSKVEDEMSLELTAKEEEEKFVKNYVMSRL